MSCPYLLHGAVIITLPIQQQGVIDLRILHTSDWHIGRRLKEHDRTEEFRSFFRWLEGVIVSENIDVLLVAGDIFDNTTPTVTAQNIYYSFLSRLAESPLRHTVIISGNHDSPSFLDAPSSLLKLSRIHVIGQASPNPADEVLTLRDESGNPELIVCAVPYLRERDIRTVTADDHDTEQALTAGILEHYARVFDYARRLHDVPVIAMGHMFLKEGRTNTDEGIRSLYVGTAPEIGADVFPDDVIYTALGHLHSAQSVGRENIRYSGSPIAMTFGEASQEKSVYVLDTEGNINAVSVPVFQRLERVSGTISELAEQLRALGQTHESIWVEVTHKGDEIIGDLQDRLSMITKPFPELEILSVYDESREPTGTVAAAEGLEKIKPMEMLELCLDANNVQEEQRKVFRPMYQEILRGLEIDY